MAEAITTSFSFEIGNESKNGHLSAEIDSRPMEEGGDNAIRLGKTSGFFPGETITFLVHKSKGVTITNKISNAGTISGGGGITVVQEDIITFTSKLSTGSLSKPASSISELKWYGRSLGDTTLDDDGMTLLLPKVDIIIPTGSSRTAISAIMAKYNVPGILGVKYNSNTSKYKITIPSKLETPFPVVIVIVGS